MSTPRQPQGIPTGGQFAATSHSEPSFHLNTPVSVGEVNRIAMFRDHCIGLRLDAEEIDPESLESKYYDRVHQHLSVQVVAAHALKHFPTATTLTIEQSDDSKSQYGIVSVNNPGGRLDEGSDWNDGGIGDTDIPTYPDEAIGSLYLEDDRWAEGIAQDPSDEHHGKRFDIDLRAALIKEKPARD